MEHTCALCHGEVETVIELRARTLDFFEYGPGKMVDEKWVQGERTLLDPPRETGFDVRTPDRRLCEDCWELVQPHWELLVEPKPPPDDEPIHASEAALTKQDDTYIGRLLKEYVGEADHGGWEGYTATDLLGIRRFLQDLALYASTYIVGTSLACLERQHADCKGSPPAPGYTGEWCGCACHSVPRTRRTS